MAERNWQRGDLDPENGKVFLHYVTTRGRRYPCFVTPARLAEIDAHNRELARRRYWRYPAKKIREVRERQARRKREAERD